MTEPIEREIALAPEQALRAVERAAEQWGAGWTADGWGGRLELPVTAGVRRGVLTGRIRATADGAGSRIAFEPESARYQLNRTAVLILALGGLGALAATLWPFFPKLLAVAPLAVVLALSAWFLVASRVRTSTPEDFLELVEMLAEGAAEDDR